MIRALASKIFPSYTPNKMSSHIIDGKLQAALIREELRRQVEGAETKPGLGYVQVGERADSSVYIRMKKRACDEVGILHYGRILSTDVSTQDVIAVVHELNADAQVHGILVQLPLPPHIDERAVIETIQPQKDVDGLTLTNMGQLFLKGLTPMYYPCTPLGCMELLRAYQVPIRGKRAVVIGRSIIVGSPVAALLQAANATVTVCHSHTPDIETITAQADILIAAMGKPKFVKAHMLKPGCTVIDVGINSVEEGTKTHLVGDVDFEACKEVAGLITPVPGGVGPMTVAMLMSNTVSAWRRSLD